MELGGRNSFFATHSADVAECVGQFEQLKTLVHDSDFFIISSLLLFSCLFYKKVNYVYNFR